MKKDGKIKSKKKIKGSHPLPVIRPDVAGIDLGATEHWVCGPVRSDRKLNIKCFRSTTPQLYELAGWLSRQGVRSVAMESTGIYWIPLYEILEAKGFEVLLVNARELNHVPGRKTDVIDCQWIQVLHSCGLLRGSFRPGESICKLRALHRECANFVDHRTQAVQGMQKALDQMNVQVHRAVSDMTGKTGMLIVRAIVGGERNPKVLAKLRDRRCKKSLKQIAEHLEGNWREEHLFNLTRALELYDFAQKTISCYEERINEEMIALQPPQRQEATLAAHPNPEKEKALKSRGEQYERELLWRFSGVDLSHIDGIATDAARVILTEVGLDVSAFPTEKHFVSWLRLNPRVSISGGKPLRKKGNATGANRISGVLRMSARSLCKSKTALGAAYRRKAMHKGGKVALFATARKLAVLVYRMLRYGQDYVDEGAEAYEARFRLRRINALRNNAKALGMCLQPIPPPT
ncbi:MAG: IS110 family transposase [Nitrospirota bacterium]|nr:IS110 family transposase [Nitrospirota bacterium]